MENGFLNQNSSKFPKQKTVKHFKAVKYKEYLDFIIKIIIFIISIILYYYLCHKKEFIKLYKEIKNEEDVKLYMKNKTAFFYKYRLKFLKRHHISYNESNLVTFQDKLNYLLIHENPELKSDIVDKIKIHQYSKKILGKDICVPILKIYKSEKKINLDELPEKFVLKANHGSGWNLICKNKSKFNINIAKKELKKWKTINYALLRSEFQYFKVERKIFSSPYLGDKLIDYEVYCFNSHPKFILVRKLLFQRNRTILHNYYNRDWKLTDIESGRPHIYRIPGIKIKKPKNLNLMLYYSKKLSSKFAFVRVDFYEINNTVYLSEMTFSPSNVLMKFKNESQSRYLGSLLDISKVQKKYS